MAAIRELPLQIAPPNPARLLVNVQSLNVMVAKLFMAAPPKVPDVLPTMLHCWADKLPSPQAMPAPPSPQELPEIVVLLTVAVPLKLIPPPKLTTLFPFTVLSRTVKLPTLLMP